MSASNPTNFDDERSAYAPLADAADAACSATITVTSANTEYASAQLTPGTYKIWMKGGLHGDTLSFVQATTAAAPSVTQGSSTISSVHEMAGDDTERVRITSAKRYLWVKYTGASATVQLSRVGE